MSVGRNGVGERLSSVSIGLGTSYLSLTFTRRSPHSRHSYPFILTLRSSRHTVNGRKKGRLTVMSRGP